MAKRGAVIAATAAPNVLETRSQPVFVKPPMFHSVGNKVSKNSTISLIPRCPSQPRRRRSRLHPPRHRVSAGRAGARKKRVWRSRSPRSARLCRSGARPRPRISRRSLHGDLDEATDHVGQPPRARPTGSAKTAGSCGRATSPRRRPLLRTPRRRRSGA